MAKGYCLEHFLNGAMIDFDIAGSEGSCNWLDNRRCGQDVCLTSSTGWAFAQVTSYLRSRRNAEPAQNIFFFKVKCLFMYLCSKVSLENMIARIQRNANRVPVCYQRSVLFFIFNKPSLRYLYQHIFIKSANFMTNNTNSL